MTTPAPDQTDLVREVLEAVKKLQISQERLAAHVDAISGRVNVLAGMKEVRDVAVDSESKSVGKDEPSTKADELPISEEAVPPSPSLPAQLGGDGSLNSISTSRKASVGATGGTSRIILT